MRISTPASCQFKPVDSAYSVWRVISRPCLLGMTDQALARLNIRPVSEADGPQIISLLSRTLGWSEDDRHRELFVWKHRDNPFGPSPAWVAEDDGGLIGFRAFMRWEFLRGGATVRSVRAVDTATDPRAQGRGVFKTLTLRAVEDMTKEGVEWVFNTPNSQSFPGYVSMGWVSLGRLPLAFRPASARVLPKLRLARAPGELWSLTTGVGVPADSLLSEAAAIDHLIAVSNSVSENDRLLRTRKSSSFLMWRYGRCPVGYRGAMIGSEISDGIILFRIRRRGPARELVIVDSVVPPASRPRVRTTLSHLLRKSGADYAIALGDSRPPAWLPLPRNGPCLAWRPLAWTCPPLEIAEYGFATGDIELF